MEVITADQASNIIELMEEIRDRLDAVASADQPMTVSQAAKWYEQSECNIRRLCISGQLPAVKVGNEWRVFRKEFDDANKK